MPTDAIPAEDFAAGLNQRMLHCRELGHTWKSWTVSFDKSARCYDRRLRCSSCRTIRKQMLDSRGHVLSNSYVYVEGYLATNVPVGISRDVFRIESITRFLSSHEDTEAAGLRAV